MGSPEFSGEDIPAPLPVWGVLRCPPSGWKGAEWSVMADWRLE